MAFSRQHLALDTVAVQLLVFTALRKRHDRTGLLYIVCYAVRVDQLAALKTVAVLRENKAFFPANQHDAISSHGVLEKIQQFFLHVRAALDDGHRVRREAVFTANKGVAGVRESGGQGCPSQGQSKYGFTK